MDKEAVVCVYTHTHTHTHTHTYIYIMEYFSGTKWNTFESVLMRWMNLEPLIQNEVSKKEKNIVC